MNKKVLRWTDADILKAAKKYKTRGEFSRSNFYNIAHSRGIEFFNKACSHMIDATELKRSKWTDDELRREAKKYKTRSEFRAKRSAAFEIAENKGIKFMNSICSHMESKEWTDDELRREAKKYKTRSEFAYNNAGAYTSARYRGKEFFNSCCSHMVALLKYWTDSSIENEAKKYNSLVEFKRGSKGAFMAGRRRGKEFLNRICSHMSRNIIWTEEMIEIEAKKYKTKLEFQGGAGGAYKKALKNKDFFNRICAHMKSTD